jgi:hypothetical protein
VRRGVGVVFEVEGESVSVGFAKQQSAGGVFEGHGVIEGITGGNEQTGVIVFVTNEGEGLARFVRMAREFR